jgi:hypothetical protein
VVRSKRELDPYERCAHDRLEPIFGALRQIDPGGGPDSLHDFEADLPGDLIAAIEVTSEVESERLALESSAGRHLSSLTLPDSGRRWLVELNAGANAKAIIPDLRRLLSDIERDGRQSVNWQGDYQDPFVQRLRDLKIELVYSWVTEAGPGIVRVGPGVYGGWGWGGAATDVWLADFLASQRGVKKLEKLGRATNATERHLVVVLHPWSQAGLCIPVGLTDLGEPGAAGSVLPSLVPPDPLSGVWLIPMVTDWHGLRWVRGSGWAVLAGVEPGSHRPAA